MTSLTGTSGRRRPRLSAPHVRVHVFGGLKTERPATEGRRCKEGSPLALRTNRRSGLKGVLALLFIAAAGGGAFAFARRDREPPAPPAAARSQATLAPAAEVPAAQPKPA